MKSLLLTVFAVIPCLFAHAQPNYQRATITTNNSETLKGWINYREWARNPSLISFKTDENAEAKVFTVKDIREFEIENMEYYERFAVNISMDKTAPVEELTSIPDHRMIEDTVLLKVISKGKIADLYAYKDLLKTRFYIREAGSDKPVELIFKKYLDQEKNLTVRRIDKYKNQLVDIAAKHKTINTAKLLDLLLTTDYNKSNILKAVDFINGGTGRKLPANQPSSVQFYAGLAMHANTSFYLGEDRLAIAGDKGSSYFPKLSLGMDFLNNPFIGRVIFRGDLSFTKGSYSVSKVRDYYGYLTHRFDQYTVSLTPQVIYNFYNTNRLKVNVGTGIGIHLSYYKNNFVEEYSYTTPSWSRVSDDKLNGVWASLPVRAGVVLKKKFEFYGQYDLPISPVTEYLNYSLMIRSWQVGFNYIF